MTQEEAIAKYGVDPEKIGNRNRGWWIVDTPDHSEQFSGIQSGDLCVKTRDGGSNPIDIDAIKSGNCVGTLEDDFDETYRYYYYRAALGEGKE